MNSYPTTISKTRVQHYKGQLFLEEKNSYNQISIAKTTLENQNIRLEIFQDFLHLVWVGGGGSQPLTGI